MFNKRKNEFPQDVRDNRVKLFQEAVNETEELYNDLSSEYETLDNAVAELKQFFVMLESKLSTEDSAMLQPLLEKLVRVDKCARNSVRDIRDILRNQKKMLSELRRDF